MFILEIFIEKEKNLRLGFVKKFFIFSFHLNISVIKIEGYIIGH